MRAGARRAAGRVWWLRACVRARLGLGGWTGGGGGRGACTWRAVGGARDAGGSRDSFLFLLLSSSEPCLVPLPFFLPLDVFPPFLPSFIINSLFTLLIASCLFISLPLLSPLFVTSSYSSFFPSLLFSPPFSLLLLSSSFSSSSLSLHLYLPHTLPSSLPLFISSPSFSPSSLPLLISSPSFTLSSPSLPSPPFPSPLSVGILVRANSKVMMTAWMMRV